MAPAMSCNSPERCCQVDSEKMPILHCQKDFRRGVNSSPDPPEPPPCRLSCKMPTTPYPIYIIVALYLLIITVERICTNSLVYNKICIKHFHNLTLCTNTSFSKRHPLLQDDATKWLNYVALIQLMPSLLSNLILSSYCDRAGHKLLLILPTVGTILACSWLAILTAAPFLHWPMETLLIYGFLNSIFGHSPMILMSAFSYITRVVSAENRHIHICLAEGSILIGVLLGNLINGPVIDSYGLQTMVYTITATSIVIALIAAFLVVDIRNREIEFTWLEAFKLNYMFDSIKCVFRSRPGYSRMTLQLCFAAYAGAYICGLAFNIMGFLYFVKEVGMTLTYYSVFTAVVSGLKATASPLILLLAKKLNIGQLTTGQISAVLMTLGYGLMSLGSKFSLMWIGGVLISVEVVVFAVCRNLQTKLVEKDETGKLFSYDALIQAIFNSAIVLSFDTIYSWSLTFWPQMYLAVSAILCVISFAILSLIIILQMLDTRADIQSSQA